MISPERYRLRQQKIFDYLSEHEIDVAVVADFEGLRNRSLRYLCGQPEDAVLFLFAPGKSLLVAWDLPLARSLATADDLIPYERYGRTLYTCIKSIVREKGSRRTELPAALPYPLVKSLLEALPEAGVECRNDGVEETINAMRMVKDPEEIDLLRRACAITDELVDGVSGLLADKGGISETELALFLEAEARRRGAEGMGFETLAASPRRSYSIHCFPNLTSDTVGIRGMSILDFGVRFGGYTSDVTVTVLAGPLSSKQEAMIVAVQEAYDMARLLCKPGTDAVTVGEEVQECFRIRGFHMPHSLGHGIGLEAHEAPLFRSTGTMDGREKRQLLKPGMVFTIEPGLYDPEQGGVRLENDFLCTDTTAELLTSAGILEVKNLRNKDDQ